MPRPLAGLIGRMDRERFLKIAASVSVAGLSAYLLYSYIRYAKRTNGLISGSGTITTDGFTTIKIQVPMDLVGAIIGRQGSNIKQIQADTKTRIDFSRSDDASGERTVTIRGTQQGCQQAELKILHIVYGQPPKKSHVMRVPLGMSGKIIGKGGETIRKLQTDCECKITIDGRGLASDDLATITLTGTEQTILCAVARIEEMVAEYEARLRRNAVTKTEDAQPNHLNGQLTANDVAHPVSTIALEVWPSNKDIVEVYVTAIANPSHIWVQLVSLRGRKLDEIHTQMNKFYDGPSGKNHGEPITSGCLVAATHPDDKCWYRATVLGIDESTHAADLYFIDYGDSAWLPVDSLSLLRPEFCSFPAQAIECFTQAVHWNETTWNDADFNKFEQMSYTGQWKVLMARCIEWQTKEDNSSIPVISLIDTHGTEDVDVIQAFWEYRASSKDQGQPEVSNKLSEMSNGLSIA